MWFSPSMQWLSRWTFWKPTLHFVMLVMEPACLSSLWGWIHPKPCLVWCKKFHVPLSWFQWSFGLCWRRNLFCVSGSFGLNYISFWPLDLFRLENIYLRQSNYPCRTKISFNLITPTPYLTPAPHYIFYLHHPPHTTFVRFFLASAHLLHIII